MTEQRETGWHMHRGTGTVHQAAACFLDDAVPVLVVPVGEARETADALRALACEAVTAISSASHSHWRVGGAGGTCGTCQAATERAADLRARFDLALAALAPHPDPAPSGALHEEVETKTPEQWCAELGARVMDPDGWRDGTRSWDEPITRDEFDRRLIRCTIDGRGYPDFLTPPYHPFAAPSPEEVDRRG